MKGLEANIGNSRSAQRESPVPDSGQARHSQGSGQYQASPAKDLGGEEISREGSVDFDGDFSFDIDAASDQMDNAIEAVQPGGCAPGGCGPCKKCFMGGEPPPMVEQEIQSHIDARESGRPPPSLEEQISAKASQAVGQQDVTAAPSVNKQENGAVPVENRESAQKHNSEADAHQQQERASSLDKGEASSSEAPTAQANPAQEYASPQASTAKSVEHQDVFEAKTPSAGVAQAETASNKQESAAQSSNVASSYKDGVGHSAGSTQYGEEAKAHVREAARNESHAQEVLGKASESTPKQETPSQPNVEVQTPPSTQESGKKEVSPVNREETAPRVENRPEPRSQEKTSPQFNVQSEPHTVQRSAAKESVPVRPNSQPHPTQNVEALRSRNDGVQRFAERQASRVQMASTGQSAPPVQSRALARGVAPLPRNVIAPPVRNVSIRAGNQLPKHAGLAKQVVSSVQPRTSAVRAATQLPRLQTPQKIRSAGLRVNLRDKLSGRVEQVVRKVFPERKLERGVRSNSSPDKSLVAKNQQSPRQIFSKFQEEFSHRVRGLLRRQPEQKHQEKNTVRDMSTGKVPLRRDSAQPHESPKGGVAQSLRQTIVKLQQELTRRVRNLQGQPEPKIQGKITAREISMSKASLKNLVAEIRKVREVMPQGMQKLAQHKATTPRQGAKRMPLEKSVKEAPVQARVEIVSPTKQVMIRLLSRNVNQMRQILRDVRRVVRSDKNFARSLAAARLRSGIVLAISTINRQIFVLLSQFQDAQLKSLILKDLLERSAEQWNIESLLMQAQTSRLLLARLQALGKNPHPAEVQKLMAKLKKKQAQQGGSQEVSQDTGAGQAVGKPIKSKQQKNNTGPSTSLDIFQDSSDGSGKGGERVAVR